MEENPINIKLEFIKQQLLELKQTNKEEHGAIISRLDFTNGKVRTLQLWKASIAGALVILGSLMGYFITSYSEQQASLIEVTKIQALNVMRITTLENKQ